MNPTTQQLRALGYNVAGGKAVPAAADKPRAKRGEGAKSQAKAKRLAAWKIDAGRSPQTLELRPPPSLNKIYGRARGRVFLTKEARAWKEFVYQKCVADRFTPFRGDVVVEVIAVNTKMDGDNILKLLFDALQGERGMYLNDRQIRDHWVIREDQGIASVFVTAWPVWSPLCPKRLATGKDGAP
jgi:Holliday junction resolvase RusA-like endonuclease